MSGLLRAAALVDRLSEGAGKVTRWLVLAMVLLGAGNALARYGGKWFGANLASNAWLEAQWYLFSLVFLFGAADALRRDAHVRVDLWYGRLGPQGKARVDVLGTVLFLLPFVAFALVMTWPSVANSWAVREMSPDPGGLPRFPLKAAVRPAFGLLFLQGLSELVKALDRARALPPGEGR